ncbi:hypothetical protein NZK35_06985 [Stieleria sp. ICT_E10.1]|uniref:hypothetical protein n=1 Tax=Stieleria sedimenti TaxID=2976331 RepID=UPI00217F5F5D|nr:hypothetical protein [Stieleria sedimenti]MCS7466418.1 hypothetical protein [Stieleria sedimenti]
MSDERRIAVVSEAYRLQSEGLDGRELFECRLLMEGWYFEFRRLVDESVSEMGLDEEMA